MRVLVDTSVWSPALRRSSRSISPAEQRLTALLRERLGAFPDEEAGTADFEEAARCANRCHAAGIAGSDFDHLICAVALRRGLAVLTTDRDFARYARVVPVRLLEMPGP